MNPIELIDAKRRGLAHSREEIFALVQQLMAGTLPDYQLSAWLMAVCCKGLTLDETVYLTDAFVQSGQTLNFNDLDGVVVDKHSTGGVGDKTTLVLAPMLAACGLKVAKLSGRGLGYTGGTIDKLEAIPGFQVGLGMADFRRQVAEIGIALGAQTAELAPADGLVYAMRDVTATVASIPLIAASVVSKKIAAGARVITLDIKVGEGAFMKTLEEAKALADTCREVGERLGRRISTVISEMNQPLGQAIGHTLEVMEAIDTLKGQGPADLRQLCLTLGGLALLETGQADSLSAGEARMVRALDSGEALAMFRRLIEAQHGDPAVLEHPTLMPQPDRIVPLPSPVDGVVMGCRALAIAQAAKALGAGRLAKGAPIDLGVGVKLLKKIGDRVAQGEPLAALWVRDQGIVDAQQLVLSGYRIGQQAVSPPPLVDLIVAGNGQLLPVPAGALS